MDTLRSVSIHTVTLLHPSPSRMATKAGQIPYYFPVVRKKCWTPLSSSTRDHVWGDKWMFLHIFSFLDSAWEASSRDIALCALLSKKWNNRINKDWPWKHVNLSRSLLAFNESKLAPCRDVENLRLFGMHKSVILFLRRHASTVETLCMDRRCVVFGSWFTPVWRTNLQRDELDLLQLLVDLAPPCLTHLYIRDCRVSKSDGKTPCLMSIQRLLSKLPEMRVIDMRQSGELMDCPIDEDMQWNYTLQTLIFPNGSHRIGICNECSTWQRQRQWNPNCKKLNFHCSCDDEGEEEEEEQEGSADETWLDEPDVECDKCFNAFCADKCCEDQHRNPGQTCYDPNCTRWDDMTLCLNCCEDVGQAQCTACCFREPHRFFCRDTCTNACSFCSDRICDECWQDWTETSELHDLSSKFRGGWCPECNKLVCLGINRHCLEEHAKACW